MWLRKCDKDRIGGLYSPIPCQIISNEEFFPLPQTELQRKVERQIEEMSDYNAKMLGMTRRQFLATSCGMATAFLAMNKVFGRFFDVDPAEALEPAASAERWPKNQFIFDLQTHHVDAGTIGPLNFRQIGAQWNPVLGERRPRPEDLYLENFIKEIFFDSDTVLGVISGVPHENPNLGILPVDKMVRTRNIINQLAGSQRMLSHGLIAPNRGPADLDEMQRQAEELKIDGWKGYTGLKIGGAGWWLDDEKVAYPLYEKSKKLKVKNVCIHKGLPLGGFSEEHSDPKDVVKAALDHPELNFIIYHAAFRYTSLGQLQSAEQQIARTGRIDWVTDLCEARKRNPKMTNVYMELGTTFGATVVTNPLITAHMLGQMLSAFGQDHIVWGTDSIWWGSPQWQIEAMRRFRIPDDLIEKHGYKPLTDKAKERIFGLNAAELFNIDVKAKRNAIPEDYLTRLKAQYRSQGAAPSNTAYGWVFEKASF